MFSLTFFTCTCFDTWSTNNRQTACPSYCESISGFFSWSHQQQYQCFILSRQLIDCIWLTRRRAYKLTCSYSFHIQGMPSRRHCVENVQTTQILLLVVIVVIVQPRPHMKMASEDQLLEDVVGACQRSLWCKDIRVWRPHQFQLLLQSMDMLGQGRFWGRIMPQPLLFSTTATGKGYALRMRTWRTPPPLNLSLGTPKKHPVAVFYLVIHTELVHGGQVLWDTL